MILPPAIATRVAKIVPMLASDRDGEVVASVRAIARALAAERLDFHALAAAIDPGTTASTFADVFRYSPPEPEPKPPTPSPWSMPIWGTSKLEHWPVVADHVLGLDWAIPKVAGGKFLTKEERARLKRLADWGASRTENDLAWLEATCHRVHAIRDASRASRSAAA